MNKLLSVTTITLLLASFVVTAGSTQETLSLQHPQIDSELNFNIQLPANYHHSTKSYVVLFDFHPYSYTYLSGMHDWMSHNGEWPWLETIIVTPAYGNKAGTLFDKSGNTTPILDFFESHLFPELDDKYRTNGFRIFSGFRHNGSLVLSALLNKPDIFDAYIAVSPEIKDDFLGLLTTAGTKLKKLSEKPRFLLFSHGESVKEEHQIELYQQLRSVINNSAPESLDAHYKNYSDKYHMSLPLVSVIDGIESIFNDVHRGIAPTSDIAAGGVSSIVQHYDWLSKQKYGFTVSPHMSLRNLGYHLFAQSPDAGIAVFQNMVKRFPEDAYSHHYLADAYAQTDNIEKAIELQQQAVSLSASMQGWHQKRHKRFLNEYLQRRAPVKTSTSQTVNNH
jgi:uncharacterized protein